MPKTIIFLSIFVLSFYHFNAAAAAAAAEAEADKEQEPAFELIVLGDAGGIHDGNLSAFLLRSLSDNQYIGLDAGTLVNGIEKAMQGSAFDDLLQVQQEVFTPTINILRHHIAAYLISHAHLDHVAGLVIASPDDSAKPIYALASVNNALSESYFNWEAWPNFSDRGKKPRLNKYKMIDLPPTTATKIPNTHLSVKAFSLSHTTESTAFIVESERDMMIYFGDTGPDAVEKEGKLESVWRYLASQQKNKNLRAIVIEVSFPDGRPDNELYGHLTPSWLSKELAILSALLDKPSALRNTKVIISHVKPSKFKDIDARSQIKQQLEQHNSADLTFILATQGQRLSL